MGRIVTPTYRVEYRTNLLAMGVLRADAASRVDGKPVQLMSWRKQNGRPTEANLETWRKDYNKSFQAGGSNAHLADANGIMHITWARIVHQRTDRVAAEVTMPTFEVV